MQCARHICLGAYANNGKCMYISALWNIDSIEFIGGIFIDTLASCLFVLWVLLWRHIARSKHLTLDY